MAAGKGEGDGLTRLHEAAVGGDDTRPATIPLHNAPTSKRLGGNTTARQMKTIRPPARA